MVFPILCGFIDPVTGYAEFSEMKRTPTMYSSLTSGVLPGNREREYANEELKAIGTKEREIEKRSWNFFLRACQKYAH